VRDRNVERRQVGNLILIAADQHNRRAGLGEDCHQWPAFAGRGKKAPVGRWQDCLKQLPKLVREGQSNRGKYQEQLAQMPQSHKILVFPQKPVRVPQYGHDEPGLPH